VQSEIARAVANALHANLTPYAADALRVIPTDNMAANRAFHEAMQLRTTITLGEPKYVSALERAVEKDYPRALRLVDLVLERRPSDLQSLEVRTWIQRRLGDLDGVSETLRRGAAIDPRSSVWETRLAWNLTLVRRYDQAATVLERSSHDTLTLALIGALLRANATGDVSRLTEEVDGIESEFAERPPPVLQWEALMVARAFSQARALLDRPPGRSWGLVAVADRGLGRLLVDWAEHGQGGNEALRSRAMDFLEEMDANAIDTFEPMVGADSEAVGCLRDGMNAPSRALTGLEPLMPYYDPIRAAPEFAAFVTESSAGTVPAFAPDSTATGL